MAAFNARKGRFVKSPFGCFNIGMESRIALNVQKVKNNTVPARKIEKAADLFCKSGAVWLENVFRPEFIESLATAFDRRYVRKGPSGLAKKFATVGHRRVMITVDVAEPFDNPDLFANPTIMQLLQQLLGPQFSLMSFGAVVAFSDADAQPVHLDHPPLFGESRFATELPPYAVTVVVPLINLDAQIGSTAIWEGSHKSQNVREQLKELTEHPTLDDAVFPTAKLGDAYLMDYRVMHGGMANDSDQPRPILYVVYSRPWFRDCVNFNNQPAVSITKATIKKLPVEVQHLFSNVK